ncbi:SHOCT domain-containing protein [Actinoplanes sp. L3-i22]|uniref:SHOCT domain-containing protein n=1 Tax=Actinoplanes sp. L3-i22 TaxID=2836373 RepID=UPI001C75E27A|nr:SHOCT domain-containing protein [Actinoplanes sp. L3-i22]BCY09997.1 hypothetical protein L3i22_050850 [Actinoplanes sp. L3-i22]
MMYDYPHVMSMGSGWAVIVVSLLLAIAVAAVVAAWPARRGSGSGPERVLADRFARGEIDAEEYEQRLRTLQISRR